MSKKSNVIVIHGAYGYPEENWFGWMMRKLKEVHVDCYVPAFPTPKNQSLKNWLNVFSQYYESIINKKTILIGHSLGAAFVLRWLEKTDRQVFSAILVGAFLGKVGIDKFDRINHSFFYAPFKWTAIQDNAKQFIIYRGDNDSYTSDQDFHLIARQLNAKKIIISCGGHLNAAAGYSQFPLLLWQVLMLIKLLGSVKE
ncbi:MAG: hypothetical protein ACD_69C00061G0001 [uncultured bacterium]|nr:MAG: hypothetical protein ACD_69C00061G0001 [uncultured bacterium]OGT47820.1 MAG: hypothetical protein A3E83_03080 [Gammaproteobacteria bacterium RIFCSPHIGHO2_12_FULL_41_20]